MPLTLHAPSRIELRWWWEGPPRGMPLRLRDPDAARRFLASLCAQPENRAALRRLLYERAPGTWRAPDEGDLEGGLATAVAADRLRIGQLPAHRLPSWDAPREEAAPASAPAPRAAPAPPPEEICWPCLRAAASARALREASAGGAPFIAQD